MNDCIFLGFRRGGTSFKTFPKLRSLFEYLKYKKSPLNIQPAHLRLQDLKIINKFTQYTIYAGN